jgi:hypothetical protein
MEAPNVEQLRIEVSGESAIDTAIRVLEQIEDGSKFERAEIKLTTSSVDNSHHDVDRQLTLEESEAVDDSPPTKLKPGTSHAKALSVLNEIDDDGPVSTRNVLEHMDLPEGTVYGAMSELHDRGLVERTDERNVGNSYGYTVSEAGQKELDRLNQLE